MSWITYKNQRGNGDYKVNDALFEKLCKESKASDYYIAVKSEESGFGITTSVTICSREFFDHFGYLLDVTPNITHLLPEWISGELQEAVLESSKSKEETLKELLRLGFSTSSAFQEMCE